ncbi:ABC transporter substrate-binding protein [Cellulosilyticum ruminicola]|uniref:ABC transporter substrate-binding protein n=1 Tax=Cellulosilyticum ruminicola TaxID=425254 RepID=UPI0006CFA88D|nr:ABC transporter substrate-binding protein [Cellulosilyticum ruminicola]
MKKKMAMILIASMMMSLSVGCGNGPQGGEASEENKTTETVAPATETIVSTGTKKVGIIQYVEHPSLDTIRESTIKALEEQGFVDGENITIDYQNAQADQSNLNSIASKFVGEKTDVVIAIATPSAQVMAAATSDIPIIFSAVTDPLGAKLVDSLESPSGNVTGTSDAIPVDETFELCKALTPDVKTFGFLYSAAEVNSESVINEAKKIAKDYGFDYKESTITATTELQQAAEILASKVDAIYVPIDNNIASAMPVLSSVGKSAGIPVYVGADSMVQDGGYATVGINYEDLGQKTGEMVADVLNGKEISEIPVATLDHFYKVINKTTAKAIGAPDNAEGATIVE